jgi:polysaccharide pyruvyl transferase CsaB
MNETRRSYRVGISGSYGGLNLGDEAILQCIITQLRHAVPVEITVFSRDAVDTLRSQRVDHAVPVRNLSRDEVIPEIERLDLFLLGGGGILFDGDAKIYMREVALCHERNIPVMTYAIGVGPLHDPENQRQVKENLNRAAALTVRERSAKKVLEDIGVEHEITVTADPALLLKPEPLPPHTLAREGIDRKDRLIGISVREPGMAAPDLNQEKYHALLANAADYMVERYDADIVFVPMEPKALDLQHSHAVMAQMLRPQRATVLKGSYSPGQTLTLMQYFMFAVGMRLHFLIFAALQGVPFVALPYASKVVGLLEELMIETPPIDLVNAGRLLAHIDNSWDAQDKLLQRIKQVLPVMQERARHTNQIAVDLLKKSRVIPPAPRAKVKSHALT